MKAAFATSYGGPGVLEIRDAPEPTPQAGEILVSVRSFGLNFADLLARMGVYPGTPKPPFIPGMEFAGEVAAVGSGASLFRLGDRVMGFSRRGSHAEYVAVSERMVVGIPRSMSFDEGAAFLVNSLSAYHGIVRLANLRRGERLLVHAAAGGVGLATVQLAHALGAEIFATAGTDRKIEVAKKEGADHVINYVTTDFSGEVRRLTAGEGVDVVMDSVGGKVFRKSWSLLSEMGRYVLFGISSLTGKGGFSRIRAAIAVSSMRPIFPPSLIPANKGIFGFNLGLLVRSEAYLREAVLELLRYQDQGSLRPVVGRTFPFKDIVEAHRFLQTRQSIGKVVVRLTDSSAGSSV